MMTFFEFEPHALIPRHRHVHEQITYVIEGEIEFSVEGETRLLSAGDGVIILSNLPSRRTADQIFPFIMLPQFFLAGVFNPIRSLPWYLDLLSRISPMRYAVDLIRDVFYVGRSDYAEAVLQGPGYNLALMFVVFMVFLVIGTFLFVRKEQNR